MQGKIGEIPYLFWSKGKFLGKSPEVGSHLGIFLESEFSASGKGRGMSDFNSF